MSTGGTVFNDETTGAPADVRLGRGNNRLDAVEGLRVIAACGVVWFHIPGGPWKDAGYAGLICFVMISAFFMMDSALKNRAAIYFNKRISRLIVPWGFWMLAYGALNQIRGKDFLPASDGRLAGLLTGTWIGLWYLPFLLSMAVLVFGLAKPSAAMPPLAGAVSWMLAGIASMCWLPGIDANWAAHTPWSQWLNAMPAVFLGMSLHETLRLPPMLRWILAASTVVMVETAAFWMWREHRGVSITYGLSIIPVAAAFLWNIRLSLRLVAAGSLCLGVYLMHALFIGGLRMIPLFRDCPLLLFPLVVILSFVATATLRRHRLAKSFV